MGWNTEAFPGSCGKRYGLPTDSTKGVNGRKVGLLVSPKTVEALQVRVPEKEVRTE